MKIKIQHTKIYSCKHIKNERTQINTLTFHLKELEKKTQAIPKQAEGRK